MMGAELWPRTAVNAEATARVVATVFMVLVDRVKK